jgi:hypothetical protein
MKMSLVVGAILMALVAVPALAGDGKVPQSVLQSLGLSGLQEMSDSDGMQVRGMSAEAFAFGASSLFAQLSDPSNPGNFVTATDINGGRGSDENAGLSADALATQGPQGSSLAVSLDIQSGNPAVQVFLGTILGNAGNASNIGAAGISAATGN